MRDLTEEELKLAPDWASKYTIDFDAGVIFVDNIGEAACFCGEASRFHFRGYYKELRPIPRKLFDISEHEFSDEDVGKAEGVYNKCINLGIYIINKSDAIAIAKALGVTGGDL